MTESSLKLADEQDLIPLAELVADLRAAAPDARVILVGAAARDLLLHYAHSIRAPRATNDFDLALAVKDWREFASLRDALLASGSFTPASKIAHRLLHRQRVDMDLIPFGGIELPDGKISWPPEGHSVISVLGLREAMASSTTAFLPLEQQIAVVSLPVLAVLKILAWSERRMSAPGRDAPDLMLILANYLATGQEERLYAEEDHLLSAEDFDFERAGAWLAGKDALNLLRLHSSNSIRVEQAVRSALEPEVDPDGPLRLIGELRETNLERARLLLMAFLAGFKGAQYP
jgi:predicted nucleotidyltransferase